MTAIRLGTATGPSERSARRALAVVTTLAVVVAFLVFRGTWTLPHNDDYDLFRSLNGVKDWVGQNRGILEPIRALVAGLVDVFDLIIESLGWPGVLGLAGALGFLFGGVRLALLGVVGFACLGVLGLWDESMAVLSMMLAAVVIAVAVGLPLGIIAGRNEKVLAAISPVLDFMQIMPTLAYLAPITLLFLIGEAPSVVATLVFAIPPAIRITALGIRTVPRSTVEAAESLGSTNRQVLAKVQLPQSRRAIGLAINQTIMLALSMVVITALIGAPGLGRNLTNALQQVNVGAAFDAGIAIVILAIILDRLTFAASEWMDPRERARHRRPGGRWVSVGIPVAILAAGLLAPFMVDATKFPDVAKFSFRGPVNALVDWIDTTFHSLTIALKDITTTVVINPIETVLTQSPWWLVIGVMALIALTLSGRRAAITTVVCLAIIALIGLWEHAMATLATVIIATFITLGLGLAIGVQTARHERFRTAIRPFLDAAQTMPAFVYLIPALALFQATRFTAIVAAVIYAMPPVIRLVEAGIRQVPATVIEAAESSGATKRQVLWKVQLPMSQPALLLAANQGIVMVLSMVVIGALVGAGALGYDVITGFAQGKDFGKGLAAGFAIVLLGILLDRITQRAGIRRQLRVAKAGAR
jgi:glycine betaine/proline transport system permease protein